MDSMRTSPSHSERAIPIHFTTVLFMLSIALLGPPRVANAQTADDVAALERRVAQLAKELHTHSSAARACPIGTPADQCPLRLYQSGSLTAHLFERLLAGRSITFRMTGGSGQLVNSGGGGAGCGYYVEVVSNDLNGDLNIRTGNSVWSSAGLALRPDFRFVAWATLHGHVRGPACPFTGCGCTIGGGAGTTVGVRAERDDSLPLQLRISNDSQGNATIALVQPADKTIDVTISIGLQGIGNVGIPTSFVLPRATYFTTTAPSTFGTQGEIEIPGVKLVQYKMTFAGQPVEVTQSGFAARLLATITR
jgi:hypothetical protein